MSSYWITWLRLAHSITIA